MENDYNYKLNINIHKILEISSVIGPGTIVSNTGENVEKRYIYHTLKELKEKIENITFEELEDAIKVMSNHEPKHAQFDILSESDWTKKMHRKYEVEKCNITEEGHFAYRTNYYLELNKNKATDYTLKESILATNESVKSTNKFQRKTIWLTIGIALIACILQGISIWNSNKQTKEVDVFKKELNDVKSTVEDLKNKQTQLIKIPVASSIKKSH